MTFSARAALPLPLALLLALSGAAPSSAQSPAQAPRSTDAAKLDMNAVEVELQELVARVAEFTGQRFVYGDALRVRITLLAEDLVSAPEALELLHASLLLAGFAALPAADKTLRIVPIRDASGLAPWLPSANAQGDERMVTSLLRLEAADAGLVMEALRPLIGEREQVVAYRPTNSLILATSEASLVRLIELVRALDFAARSQRAVIVLRHADASTAASQVAEVFERARPGTGRRGIVADQRTNSLIIEASPEQLAEIRAFLARIDRPQVSRASLHVLRVANADAEDLADTLRALAGSGELGEELAQGSYDIVADAPTNSLVIRAQPDAYGALLGVIDELDRVPPRVGIDVKLIEVEHNNAVSLSFDGFLGVTPIEDDSTLVFATIGNPAAAQSEAALEAPFVARITRAPVLLPIVGPTGPTMVLVPSGAGQILAARGEASARTLLSPFLLATSGDEQRIVVGDEIPVPESTEQVAGGAFTTGVTIRREDVGVELRLTPNVVSERVVEIDVDARFSSVASGVAADALTPLASAVGPVLNRRELTTHVRLVDGTVAVIGTVPQQRRLHGESGVPFLSQIPILKHFVRRTNDQERHSQLLIVLQATMLGSPASQRADAIERRAALQRQQLRTSPLRSLTREPFALLVATRATRPDALAVARLLADEPGELHIVEWRLEGAAHFDVYLAGFPDPAPLAPLAVKLRGLGFQPKLSVASQNMTSFQ